MKLRNLIFALFLAIGAIGFTACTGDDGSQGPKGDKGDQGEPGPPGEDAGAGSVEYNYSFLMNWGKSSGKMACDDPLLTETGMFPGPELDALPVATEAQRTALVTAASNSEATKNGYVEVACSNDVFDLINPDANGDGTGDLVSPAGTDDAPTLVFIKSHRGGDAAPVPQEGSKAATTGVAGVSITEQKSFTEGSFYADMDSRGGSDEAIQRGQLYHQCGIGTAPGALKGQWRAVNITNIKQNTQIGDNGLEIVLANTLVTTTTQKVCLRLDSLPGAVKCYVREQTAVNDGSNPAVVGSVAAGVMASDTEKIIIYGDGTAPEVVMPNAAAATATTNPGKLNPTAADADEQFIGNANDFHGAKLCNLFKEAAPDPG